MESTAMPGEDWPELHRARRAIVVVDVVESVRLMQRDEQGFIRRWRALVAQLRQALSIGRGGRLVKSLGDGLLLEFDTVANAIALARQTLSEAQQINSGLDSADALMLRVGVHLAEVVADDLDIYGSGVNLAARLAALAEPDSIVVSPTVRDELIPGLDPECVDLGECFVKHLREPVRAFRLEARARSVVAAEAPPAPADVLLPTLAILPPRCSADTPGGAVAADVVHDSIVASMVGRSELRVISRLSSLRLGGRTDLPDGFLKTLGADFVLAGTCRVLGQSLVATLELSDARSGLAIRVLQERSSVDALMAPGCELVERVTNAVVDALVGAEARRATSQPLPTLQSHELHAGAVSLMHRASGQGFERVHDMLEHLIERHGRIAAPRAWMGKWHVLRVTRGLVSDPQREASQALDHARRAVDADPNCALALAMEGFVHCHLRRDLDMAAQRLDQAIAVGPSESLAWLFRGVVHAFRDQGDDAVRCAERALALSPLDPLRYYFDSLAAAAAVSAGRVDRAIELAERSLLSNSLHTSTYRTLAIAQVLAGEGDAARQTVARLLALEPGFNIERFLARAPAGSSAIGQRFAQALAEAGVPRGGGAN